ncbi:MAG TPA: DUF4349 domain-containing protein [Planctomycetota bacterium]|nr:DUF4349 domain-containing protein [Planctomycetota bacterium]
MRYRPGFWPFLFTLLFVACQAPDDFSNASGGLDMDDFGSADGGRSFASGNMGTSTTLDEVTNGLVASPKPAPTMNAFEAEGGETSLPVPSALSPPRELPERMLVHRGELRVEVARPEESMTSFRDQVVAWGGHLQSQTDHTLVVRVPVQHFEAAFAWVKQAGRVLFESRQAADVTEEFVDLGIRLDNARKARDRLLEVLQKADKVEDILKVEAELRRLTEEIERMEGRKKFLADQVALSTLSATFQALADAPVKKGARQPSRFPWINRIGAERVVEDFR